MDKKLLRQKAKVERQKLTQEEIEDKSLAIANQLLRMDAVPSLKLVWNKLYYHLFLTIEEQKEINTEYILQILAGKDKEIVISKCDFATLGMTHFLLTDNTKIKKNSYNVPEPVDGLEVPAEWDCPRCGFPAGQDKNKPPMPMKNEPYKTHLAYVKERRTEAEANKILDIAIKKLRGED